MRRGYSALLAVSLLLAAPAGAETASQVFQQVSPSVVVVLIRQCAHDAVDCLAPMVPRTSWAGLSLIGYLTPAIGTLDQCRDPDPVTWTRSCSFVFTDFSPICRHRLNAAHD